MPDLKLNFGSTSINLNAKGDLVNYLSPGTAGLIQIAGELVPLAGRTFAEIAEQSVTTGFSLDRQGKWTPSGVPVTLSVKASASGTVSIRKSGELFSYRLGDNPKKTVSVSVPQGRVYVVLTLNAGMSVAAGAKFSSGEFGVSGSISDSDTFAVSNYKSFPDTTLVADGIAQAFEDFRLPFSAASIDLLGDGDYLDYSFIGSLALGFGATWGVSGLLLGGRSGGQIKESLNSKLGSLAFAAKPTFKASAEFSIKYTHSDAFRVVVGRTNTAASNGASLYLFRSDKGDLKTQFTAGIELSANASFNAKSNINSVVDQAAASIESMLPAELKDLVAPRVAAALKAPEAKLDAFVKDANTKVNGLLDKVNDKDGNLKVQLQILQEETTTDTALFQYSFDLGVDPTLAGLSAALAGDYVAALSSRGVELAPGAFIEHTFVSSSGFGLQFFGLWHFADVSTYFDNVTTTYAGNGRFNLVAKIGKSEESGPLGKSGICQVYFSATGAEDAKGRTFSDLDVKLNFESVDTHNPGSARKTESALRLLGDEALSSVAGTLAGIDFGSRTLKVSCVIPSASFGLLNFDETDHPLPRFNDGRNYNRFAKAVAALNPETPAQFDSFSNWVAFNRSTSLGDPNAIPDRRLFGPSAVPGDLGRTKLNFFFEQAQSFMNLCEDLRNLSGVISQADTEAGTTKLLENLKRILRQDFGVFIQPSMVALVQCMNAQVAKVQFSGSNPAGMALDTISASFEVETSNA